MNLLIQFLLRLSFGLAVGMAITSARRVTSGYFRNHLYVVLGLTTLAAVVSYYLPSGVDLVTQESQRFSFGMCIAAAVLSYVGSIMWLYEKSTLGKAYLILLATTCLGSACANINTARMALVREPAVVDKYVEFPDPQGQISKQDSEQIKSSLHVLHSLKFKSIFSGCIAVISSGLLLGITMAAMLLGHWYLNSPTMELLPLQRLILAIGVAVVLQMIVSALGLWGELNYAHEFSTQWVWFLVLRWSFGLVGVAALAWMAWETLKVPNTQSATGILYVAVIGTFVGETMALLLSAESMFPL